jgi:uncharacterized protein (TIGR03067 family)
MRVQALLIAAIGLLTGADDAVQKEYQRFEGTWLFASIEMDGMKLPLEQFKDSKLVVMPGGKFTMVAGPTTYGGTFKVDTSKTPRHIDVTFTEGPEKGKTLLGIYELEGETYKLCMADTGKDRPTAFASKPGSGHVLEVFKRQK